MSTIKKRKSSPNQWSWTSQLYNASSLANEATEQLETIEQLERALERSQKKSGELSKNLEEWKLAYEEWKASCLKYQKKDESNQVQITSLKSDNAQKQVEIDQLRQEMAAQTKHQSAGNDQKQVENQKLQHELEEMKGIISDFETNLHETKRECTENRARKKMWKKKYEELATMGAIALAKVTKESYGVTPEQFEAYKNIADTQFEVDKAEKMRTDALKLLHANTKALEDM